MRLANYTQYNYTIISMLALENIIIYGVLFLVLLLVIWAILTEIRLRKFFAGKNGQSLESVIRDLEKELGRLGGAKENIEKNLSHIEKSLRRCVQGVGIVRFNAFADSGGNQSFAIALINEAGDGVIISSLYSREKVSVFAKPIINNKSEFELTEEEKEAIKRARLS